MDQSWELLVVSLLYSLYFALDVVQNAHLAMILDGTVVAFSLGAARYGGYIGL